MPESGERRPLLVRAGEGESVWSLGGRFTAKATSAVTEGRFALVEAVAFQATEPPLHIHHREDEAWYILDGKMTFPGFRATAPAGGVRRSWRPGGRRRARQPGPRPR